MEDSPSSALSARPAAAHAPRTSRPWLWAVAGVVALAIVGGGYWGWTVMQERSLTEARATAETHWKAASASLDTIAAVTDKLVVAKPADARTSMPAMVSSLETMTITATGELDAVADAVAGFPASSEKSLYSIAILSAREAVAKSGAVVPTLKVLPEFYVGAAQVAASLKRARTSVNSSIASSNADKWATAASSATKALADCATAGKTLGKLKTLRASQSGITDTGDIAAGLSQVTLERALAQGALDVAQAGKGSVSDYNKAVAHYNKAVTAANKTNDPESLASPVIFAKGALDTLRSAKDLVGDARTRHDRAVQASLVTR